MNTRATEKSDRNPQRAPSPKSVTFAAGEAGDALPHLGRDASTIVMQRMILPPGGSTGWHYHPGPLLVVVSSGSLTHTSADLSSHVLTAGQCAVEASGPDNVHKGENREAAPLVLHVVYFLPQDSPLSVPMDPPDAAGPAMSGGRRR
ncbi:cupin domain-containing protein [Actinomadura terrae]|uniref:cupin domain-containing protein n=1 Tax=Actinomadura terrae TaxID=604353 RepID=UPI003556C87E